jgi:Recombination endonuclease VII
MGTLPDIQVAGATLHFTSHRACSQCPEPGMHVAHSLGRWVAEECASHIDPGAAAAITEIALEIKAARQGQLDADPACWSWPVPESCAGDPYRVLERWHDGRCGICGHLDALVDDHDHETNLIRGLLCQGCNLTEGRSSMPIIRRYRERHPAAILGLQVPYAYPFGRAPRPVA